MSAVLDGLRHPVIAAPMAGGPSTPALVAAVGAAGGLGFLAAGYRTVAQLETDLDDVQRRATAPYGVNVFVPDPTTVDDNTLQAYVRRLAPEAERLGVALGAPVADDDAYDAKVALMLERPVSVVSFTFGLPTAHVVDALHARGSEVWVTITNPHAAAEAEDRGADALVVQGAEAGAHRGGADDTDDLALLPLLRLVRRRTSAPLVAAGGIADGAAVAAVLAAGASAAQLGTAFLRCPEAGTSAVHRAVVGNETTTWLTRSFTGRRARGIANRFLLEHDSAAPRAYPQVHHVTAPLRAAARAAGDADMLPLWAGQAHALARDVPAAQLVQELVDGARQAATALQHRLR